MEKIYAKPFRSGHAVPVLNAKVEDGKVVTEWVTVPGGEWRDGEAPWGLLGLTEDEIRKRGFRLQPEER